MNAGRVLAFLIPLSFASSPALAQPAAPPGKAPGKGAVVFIDPVTGKIRQPEPAEIGALTAPPAATAPPAVDAPLLMKTGPGGAVGVVLDSRFESFMVVTRTPDGKLAMECVTGGKKADETVAAGAKPEPKPDGKEAARVR